MQSDPQADAGRRAFLKTACFAGLCARLPSNGLAFPGTDARAAGAAPPDLPGRWVLALLPALGTLESDRAREVVGSASAAHYTQLGMDDVLAPFAGDLPGFLGFLRSEWDWIVEYDPETGVVLANENKDRCVCPLVPEDPPDGLGALCHCSAGFAGRMFSTVAGVPAHAEVVESILRGGSRCRYRVTLRGRRAEGP